MAIGMVLRGTGMAQEHVPTLSGDMNAADVRETLHYVAAGGRFRAWIREAEERARKILTDAGHNPDRPGFLSSPVEHGSQLAIAHELLRGIRIYRAAIESGDIEALERAGRRISSLVLEHDFRVDWEKAAVRGQAFIDEPKAKRTNLLICSIDDALRELGRHANFKAVLHYLHTKKGFDVDQQAQAIYGKTRDDREKKTSFKALKNRIAERRRRITDPDSRNKV